MRVVVCLVVGVVVNVLVAWGCVWLSPAAPLSSRTAARSSEALRWQCVVPPEWPSKPMHRVRNSSLWHLNDGDFASEHPKGASGGPGKATSITTVLYQANWAKYGLPFRSLGVGSVSVLESTGTSSTFRVDGRELFFVERWQRGMQLLRPLPKNVMPWSQQAKAFKPSVFSRFLPLWPLWPGFVLNTVVYGAAVWCVMFAPGFVRRASRRKRGRCAGCGYELAGLVKCPECGEEVESGKLGKSQKK